jgi:hypothetical protein
MLAAIWDAVSDQSIETTDPLYKRASPASIHRPKHRLLTPPPILLAIAVQFLIC